MLVDTSGLFAALDTAQPGHRRCRSAVESSQEPLILSPFVLAELDYMIRRDAGVDRTLDLLDNVGAGAYSLAGFRSDDVAEAAAIVRRFRDLGVGLADASICVLARRHDVRDVLTLDERHFRVLPGPGGAPFRLLPADA